MAVLPDGLLHGLAVPVLLVGHLLAAATLGLLTSALADVREAHREFFDSPDVHAIDLRGRHVMVLTTPDLVTGIYGLATMDMLGRPLPEARIRDLLEQLLRELGIEKLRGSPAPALSGGERRRVEIARALATDPGYILLDEPLAGIDPIAVGEIRDLVRHLKDRGIGVLITDHNVRETLGLTDRAYIVYAGEVLTEGTPDEIVNDPDVRRLYLGEEFRL